MLLEILLLVFSLFLYLYWYITKNFGYFKERGITEDKPVFPFGSSPMWALMTRKTTLMTFLDELINKYPEEKCVGTYAFGQKTLVVKDLELAKRVLIKDSDHFTDRRVIQTGSKTEGDKIFDNFLTQLKGDKWKKIRTIVSPVFTSGKLKLMTSHVEKCSQYLELFLGEVASKGEPVEAKDVFGKFNLDAIATSGFGIEHNSFNDPDSKFRQTALKMIRAEGYNSWTDMPKMFFIMLFPKLAGKLGISFLPNGTMEFFAAIIRMTIETRRKTGQRRNDIIDLLVDELKQDKPSAPKDEAEDEFEKDANIDMSKVQDVELDMEIALISNAIIFFFAGFDTTSTTLGITMFGMANNTEAQNRVREEIEEVIGDSKKINFEHLQDLKYMENFINESARFYGLINNIERVCTKDYRIPGTDFVVPTGMFVQVASKSYAEECFANANEFDPENFDASNNPNKFGFSAFGQGPRNCIGMRYAMMTMKLALVHTLRKFRVVKCDKTVEKLEFNTVKNYFNGGIWFNVEKIEQEEE